MDKAQRLAAVTQKLESEAGKLPLTRKPQDTVPSEGNPDATLMFIGEAAGYHEAVQRRPFVGQAGKLLTESLEEIGIKRKDVFIANMLKCRPPDNRDPLPEEIEAFRPFLDEEIKIIQPKIIATLGRFSLGKFIPEAKISRVHGQPRWVDFQGQKILVLPLYHPAAALRSGMVMSMFKADFQKLPKFLATINTQDDLVTQEEEKPEEQVDQLSLI